MNHRSGRGFPHDRLAAAREAAAKRESLLARLRENALRQKQSVDGPDANSTQPRLLATNIPLRTAENEATQLSEAYIRLVEIIGQSAVDHRSRAVLCWPARNISIFSCYALTALALCKTGEKVSTSYERPPQFRALFYPWTSHVRLPARQIHILKEGVRQPHLAHYQNCKDKSGDPLADLSLCLLRLADLNGLVNDGNRYTEFLNPTLEELIPSGPCQGSPGSHHGVLHRCRSKTQLGNLSGGTNASAPHTAPYFLFGLHAASDTRAALRSLPPPVHLLFLDLTASGRNRLTPDWHAPTGRFLEAARAILPGVPIVAITDDPWVHRELMWRYLKEHDQIKGKKPALNEALFASTPAVIKAGEAPNGCTGCSSIRAMGFAGNLDVTLDEIAGLRSRAENLHDSSAVTVLGELAQILRRCANLPGCVGGLGNYVVDQAGELAAVNIMRFYRVPRIISELSGLEGPLAQSRRDALQKLATDARAVWDAQGASSPMFAMLKQTLRSYLGNSSKTAVLLRNSMICEYAFAALSTDPEIGEAIKHRVEKKMLYFIDEIGLRETTALPPRERHQINALIHVCPTRNQLLATMTLPWLPERQLVLADGRTLAAISRDARQLAEYAAFAEFAPRLNRLADACQSEADTVYGRKLVLEPSSAPPPDVDFPSGRTIDLAGNTAPNETLIKIETDSHQTILARQGTRLLEYETSSAIPRYRAVQAREVETGDSLCVIDDEFIDMARIRLDIVHTANEEIRTYHQLVSALYAAIPAISERRRRIELVTRINQQRTSDADREIDEATVGYWVDLADELELPLEEVTPHAPRDRPTFLRFARALGIADQEAERFWRWVIIATRSNRLRAAHQLHDAYLAILIAPHAAEAENPKRVGDIRALRAAAERYVTRVVSCTKGKRAELCK